MSEENRKRKKSFYKGKFGSKKGRYESELRPKLKGFIVTCGGQDRNTIFEAYRILNEYADKRYGPEIKDPADDGSGDDVDDIDSALKKEVSDIKAAAASKDRRFQMVKNKAKNVIFIKTTLENPTELLKDIFDDFMASNTTKTKYCCKFLPVVDTCHAKTDHIIEAAKPLIENFFVSNDKPFSYCLMFKARCNSGVKREDIYPDLVKILKDVENGHTVSYSNPDVVINIDVLGNICCFGFLRDYHKYGKYNLDTVCKKNVNAVAEADTESSKKEADREMKEVEPTTAAALKTEPTSSPKEDNDQHVQKADIGNIINSEAVDNKEVKVDTKPQPTENEDIDTPKTAELEPPNIQNEADSQEIQ